jgi:AcrR family transcriptional regulator
LAFSGLVLRLGNVYNDNMEVNANSVNIKNYHHGDLRSAVLEEGLRLLETGTAETLSLREVARNVGVSAPAVYRHFPDKAAFLKALAAEGYDQLAREQAAAAQGKGREAFAASGRAYVRFAVANPGLFRLIFTSASATPPKLAEERAGSAGGELVRHVAGVLGGSASETEQKILAYRSWSLVHGLAMLILDRQIDQSEGMTLLSAIVSGDSV